MVGDALSDPRAVNCTVAVAWAAGGAGEAFEGAGPDQFENCRRAYSHAAGGVVLGTIAASVLAGVLSGALTNNIVTEALGAALLTIAPFFWWTRFVREPSFYPGQEPQPELDEDRDMFRLWRKEEDRL